MSMISDVDYLLQSVRLSVLRGCDDPSTSRIVCLDPSFSLNPYINATGLSDVDQWPEITRALDSPPLERPRNVRPGEDRPRRRGGSAGALAGPSGEGASGLNYTQTIMGGKSGGAGMRVHGRRGRGRRPSTGTNGEDRREVLKSVSPGVDRTPRGFQRGDALGRPRADSAPMPSSMPGPRITSTLHGTLSPDLGIAELENAMSVSGTSGNDEDDTGPIDGYDPDLSPEVGVSRPILPTVDVSGPLALDVGVVDEGSDVDDEELAEDEADLDDAARERRAGARVSTIPPPLPSGEEDIVFRAVPVTQANAGPSALTMALNKHIPHLVSTASELSTTTPSHNPFASLYSSVAAAANAPSISLELYFPHSDSPTDPIVVKVRKDATVEEVTGHGLLQYWNQNREPRLSDDESDPKSTTVGWGLRIVEDDGEVDEDFPPLDRDSRVSKFSYGQFAIVEATPTQIKQNAAKAPHVLRRPSRVIARPSDVKPAARPNLPTQTSSNTLSSSLSSDQLAVQAMATSAMKGSVGLSSALSKTVLLRVKVTASADVHFTTTISVPSDMYIADLTEVLCKKKRLQNPASDWVLCLDDLSLALPLDRTVASLEGRTNLALVRRQWAVEHGLRIGDRRGGDPSASIFKRMSEPPAKAAGADFNQTYKKYHVQRKIAIGRHPRILAIDGDYIHIMPSESRTFFDSMKTTSFHITLVASCKLSGRYGGFKINVWRDGTQKRYEFEADTSKLAAEIISTIRALMKSSQTDRTSMLPPPRTMTSTTRR